MPVTIKVDVREPDLIKNLKHTLQCIPATDISSSIRLKEEALDVGDVAILNETTQEVLLLIERKTVADLLASLTDGRYQEQSYRLCGASGVPRHNIVYLIEGMVHGTAIQSKIFTMMHSLQYYKGFSVMRAMSVAESAIIIYHMANKLNKHLTDRTPFYSPGAPSVMASPSADDASKEYIKCTVKSKKRDNITKGNIGEIMLMQIPGVSAAVASVVFSNFNTMAELVTAIHTDPACLNRLTMKCGTQQDKERKLNKTTISTIVEYLS